MATLTNLFPLTTKSMKIFIITAILLALGIVPLAIIDYRGHVKSAVTDDLEICLVFNNPDSTSSMRKATYPDAIRECLEYARDNSHWRPYFSPNN